MNTLARCSGILLLLSLTLFPFTNETQLSLPIRIIANARDQAELDIHDIHLMVNGTSREIIHLKEKKRSLSGMPDLGRHFILSFHNIKGSSPIENAIAYFLSEILGPMDSLLLISPIKAYRIPITQDKQKMTMDVCQILSEDSALYEKNRISAEKKLESDLHRLHTIASSQIVAISPDGTRDSEQVLSQATDATTNYKAIYQVLLNFPQSFTRFTNQYLLPDIIRHQTIEGLLGKKQGDIWWIHFQHREDFQIIQKARSAGQRLGTYISTHESGPLAQTMEKSLADFEKQLLISESFPQKDILDTLLGKNICFNVVHWGSLRSDDTDTSSGEILELEAAMRRIAECSGGKNVVATDLEQGIKEITNHTDIYYDLAFGLDAAVEELKIHITANRPNLQLSYKMNFSKEETEEWIRTLTKKKVTICDIAVRQNTVHFEIESFHVDREKHFGLLKVRIRLFDEQDRNVHQSENTLRASQNNVKISVPFSPEYRGKFLLVIQVFDLLANTSASSEQFIELHGE